MICFDVKARCIADLCLSYFDCFVEFLHGLSENTAAKNGPFLLT